MSKSYNDDSRVQQIREAASKFASSRLSRGNLRIQEGAFATSEEWDRRRESQADRMARIKKKLS